MSRLKIGSPVVSSEVLTTNFIGPGYQNMSSVLAYCRTRRNFDLEVRDLYDYTRHELVQLANELHRSEVRPRETQNTQAVCTMGC
jgi:hypothetical protein